MYICSKCGELLGDNAAICFNCKNIISEEVKKHLDSSVCKPHIELNKKNKKNNFQAIVNRFFGTKRKKLIFGIISLLMLFLIVFTLFVKKDFIEIIKVTDVCVENTNYLETQVGNIENMENMTSEQIINLSLCMWITDETIGKVRSKYNCLSDLDKKMYNSYLSIRYNMTWDELNDIYYSYGLVSTTGSEAINNGSEYYLNLLAEIYHSQN